MPEHVYRKVALQVEVEYLKKSLYLDSKERAFTDLDMVYAVNVPLLNNEGSIRRHLKTIMDFWHEIRQGRGNPLLTRDVIGIAAFLDEFPGAEERVLSFARERHAFNEGAMRDYLTNAAPVLSEGVI
jgi:hypothetical protein